MSIITGDCVFCGATSVPIDNEHAYPDWIIRLIQERRGVGKGKGGKDLLVRVSHADKLVREYKTRDPETIVKAPCKTCNCGWMSALESSVIDFFRPMVVGQPVFINHSQGARLARWAVKTAMTHEFIDVGERTSYRYFTYADRLAVRQGSFPDREIRLWAVRASSGRALGFESVAMRAQPSSWTSFLLYSAAMFIDNIALQLLVYPPGLNAERLPTTKGPWDRLVQLFPFNYAEPFLWPPPFEELFDEDLYRLLDRFVTGTTILAPEALAKRSL